LINFAYAVWFLVSGAFHAPPIDLSQKQMNCLYVNVYKEARGENLHAKLAVAKVTLNRVRSDRFGETICQVVKQPNQFSWYENSKSMEIKFRNEIDKQAYSQVQLASNIAIILDKLGLDFMSKADHYHTVKVSPSWNKDMEEIGVIGQHRFFKGE
jgi:N-acetylmuramoyl-L-alanine amidase